MAIEVQFYGIPLKCKTDRIHNELFSGSLHTKLALIVALVTAYIWTKYGVRAEITEIFRTEAEQKAIYPNSDYKMSVHQDWRGVDIVIRELQGNDQNTAYKVIESMINKLIPYGGDGTHNTCLAHSVGSGYHLHFQVRWDK